MSKVCLGEIYVYIQGPKARIRVDVQDIVLPLSADFKKVQVCEDIEDENHEPLLGH